MSIFFETSSLFSDMELVLEDSNEDDMTLDPDDGPDEDSSQSTDNSNEDSSEGDDNSNTDEDQANDNNDKNQDDTTDDNSNTDEDNSGEDDDMSLDPDEDPYSGDDSTADSGEEGTDDSTDDNSMEGNEEDTDENDPNTRLKELEKSIFDQLSKEQKALKTKELKSLYDVVYNKCTDIINTISGANRSPEQAKIYDYVMNSLTDLQKYIKDYLMQIFDSKTYIENMVQLQKYLTILDTVSNIFEEVKKSSDMQNTTN